MNTLLLTDSYKVTHFNAYPPGMTDMFSFFESRGGKYSETVFFGLQYFLKKYLETPITQVDVEEAASLYKAHFGMELLNYDGWSYIAQKLGGRLPVRIRAVPEGSVVPTKNVLMTVESTDPKVPWVVNYLEGLLSQVWYPTTVATQSREMKKDILVGLHVSGDPSTIGFKLHDFGFRGSTSPESAALGGAAHLVNFLGTDTVPALVMLRDYYESPCAGFSIPAAEHSTITSWLRENEGTAYRKMLDVNPEGLVAIVADSYDVYNACENLFGGELKDQILSRDGVLVCRPDSGEPTKVLPRILSILADRFGHTVNAKGYKVLNPKVRVIQGDGIDADSLMPIMKAVTKAGWSIDNLAFGSGGGLLQKVNRDTQKFAFKCSAVKIDGTWREVLKDPITDPGKKSKAGRLGYKNGKTIASLGQDYDPGDLITVYENGQVVTHYTLEDVRSRAAL